MRQAGVEERENRRNRRVGEFLAALTEGRGTTGIEGGRVTRITVRLPTETEPEVLLVVKVAGSDGSVVGFVGGLDVCQAILVWAAKDRASGLKWRVDRPWSGS